MMSTTSPKNKLRQGLSVIAWDIKSCGKVCAVFSILAVVSSIVIMTICLSATSSLYAVETFQLISMYFVAALAEIFTIIYMVKTFSYLHNKRKADLYGNLPIDRITLFLSKSVSSFLLALIPTFFFMGIISIISLCCGTPLGNETISLFIQLPLGTLAVVAAYGLLAVCCGTTTNTIVMLLTVSISYPLSAFFVKGVFGAFYKGAYTPIRFNSFIMQALNPFAAYDGNFIYWLLFSGVCICASLLLVKRRKAERAQSAFAYYLPCHIVKALVAFLFGMIIGTIFGSLNVFGFALAGFIFGFILGGATAFVLSHLAFYKGFTKLLKSSVVLGALIIVVSAAMTVIDLDASGFNQFVPMTDDVQSAGLIDINYTYTESGKNIGELTLDSVNDFTDKDTISKITFAHSDLVQINKRSSAEKYSNIWIEMANSDPHSFGSSIGIAYKLKDGSIVSRVYSYSRIEGLLNALVNEDYSLYYPYNSADTNEIAATKKYQEKHSGYLNASLDSISNIGVADISIINQSVSKDSYEKIIEAIRKDYRNDTDKSGLLYIPEITYSEQISLLDSNVYDKKIAINISYSKRNIADLNNSIMSDFYNKLSPEAETYNETICIPPTYKNTIKALKEANILDKDGKVISGENPSYYSFIDGNDVYSYGGYDADSKAYTYY